MYAYMNSYEQTTSFAKRQEDEVDSAHLNYIMYVCMHALWII